MNLFITYTNKNFELTLYIKFIDKDTISIKYGKDLLYLGSPSQIPTHINDFIKPYMHKHFGPSYEKYFNLPLSSYKDYDNDAWLYFLGSKFFKFLGKEIGGKL